MNLLKGRSCKLNEILKSQLGICLLPPLLSPRQLGGGAGASSLLLPSPSPVSHSLSAAAICASRGEWFTNLKARVTDADDGLAEGGRKVATPKRKKFLNGVAAAATRVGWGP